MKRSLFLGIILFIFTGCAIDYQPADFYVNNEDAGISDYFPDSIGVWQGDFSLNWSNDSSASICASYGDSDIYFQVVKLENKKYAKKIIRDRIMSKLKGLHLKTKYHGFDYYLDSDDRTILIWQDKYYIFYVNFKNDNKDIAIDSCYFLTWK